MSEMTYTATDGTQLPVDSLANAFTYDVSGNVHTITVVYPSLQTGVETKYIQTFTFSGANVTSISQWVASGPA